MKDSLGRNLTIHPDESGNASNDSPFSEAAHKQVTIFRRAREEEHATGEH